MQAAAEDGTGTFDVEATLVPLGEEVKEVQAIDESSAMLLRIFNGGVAAFAMASAMVGLMWGKDNKNARESVSSVQR